VVEYRRCREKVGAPPLYLADYLTDEGLRVANYIGLVEDDILELVLDETRIDAALDHLLPILARIAIGVVLSGGALRIYRS
jgi:hypothetical protein